MEHIALSGVYRSAARMHRSMLNDQLPSSGPVALGEEELIVTKRVVNTGSVRLSTHVEEHVEQVREALLRTDVEMERIQVGRIVDTVPEVRIEGDTLVYPIVEEVLVKQLILREEVRITRRQHSEPFNQDVILRRVRADVEHSPASLRPETPTEPS